MSFKIRRLLDFCIPLFVIALLLSGAAAIQSQGAESITPAGIAKRIIPDGGRATDYGLPLSLSFTQKFINYNKSIMLTARQKDIRHRALAELKAPCCDDNSADTCCCPCNLSKSVWGLTKYVISEKGFDVQQTRKSALEWLMFTRSNYYIVRELLNGRVAPAKFDLVEESSCYVGKCELPFVDGAVAAWVRCE